MICCIGLDKIDENLFIFGMDPATSKRLHDEPE
jgi:hypothetical protein